MENAEKQKHSDHADLSKTDIIPLKQCITFLVKRKRMNQPYMPTPLHHHWLPFSSFVSLLWKCFLIAKVSDNYWKYVSVWIKKKNKMDNKSSNRIRNNGWYEHPLLDLCKLCIIGVERVGYYRFPWKWLYTELK